MTDEEVKIDPVTKNQYRKNVGISCKPLQISDKTNSVNLPRTVRRSPIPSLYDNLLDIMCPVGGHYFLIEESSTVITTGTFEVKYPRGSAK